MATLTNSVESKLNVGETAPIGSQILGMQFNPTRRRFHFIATTSNVNLNSATTGFVQFTLTATTTQLAPFVRFAPFAFLDSLTMTALPGPGARNAQTQMAAAWIPSSESFPTTTDLLYEFPSAQTVLIGPVLRGGLVEPVNFPATFDWGVQPQLKPTPMIGGLPRFAAFWTLQAMPEASGTQVMFSWAVTAVVTIDRSAVNRVGSLA